MGRARGGGGWGNGVVEACQGLWGWNGLFLGLIAPLPAIKWLDPPGTIFSILFRALLLFICSSVSAFFIISFQQVLFSLLSRTCFIFIMLRISLYSII